MDPLSPLISALHDEGRLRVWSLVITVFGDSVQLRGGRIANLRLQKLLGRIGIEPGTIRTALSRLGRDGWVTSEREGRNSYYRLTAEGLAQFADATSRIYAPPRAQPVTKWVLAVGADQPGIHVAPGVTLRPADQPGPAPDCAVVGELSNLSAALRSDLLSKPHVAALNALFRDLDALSGASLTPLEAAAARTLLIHRWRRIVLRHPEPPIELLPPAFHGRDPRSEVARTYAALTVSAEEWFDTPLQDVSPMPPAALDLLKRFQQA
jgi:phenylacetic acid degradation operon negative regulatory protein